MWQACFLSLALLLTACTPPAQDEALAGDVFLSLQLHTSAWNEAAADAMGAYIDPELSVDETVDAMDIARSRMRTVVTELTLAVADIPDARLRLLLEPIVQNYREKLKAVARLRNAVRRQDADQGQAAREELAQLGDEAVQLLRDLTQGLGSLGISDSAARELRSMVEALASHREGLREETDTGLGRDLQRRFVELLDATDSISVEVPRTWRDVDRDPTKGETPALAASTNLEKYWESYDVPGLMMFVLEDFSGDREGLLGEFSDDPRAACDNVEQQNYVDPAFEGLMEWYTQCGRRNATVVHLAAEHIESNDGVFLAVQVLGGSSNETVQHVLDTFMFP
jgi:hypothetical protein